MLDSFNVCFESGSSTVQKRVHQTNPTKPRVRFTYCRSMALYLLLVSEIQTCSQDYLSKERIDISEYSIVLEKFKVAYIIQA